MSRPFDSLPALLRACRHALLNQGEDLGRSELGAAGVERR